MEKLRFFETHAHLDHKLYKGQGPILADELKYAGVEKIVIPAITAESNQVARELFDRDNYPFVLFASGLHPKIASYIIDDRYDWDIISGYLSDDRTVAVKTGLDLSDQYFTDKHISNQKQVLQHLLRLADQHSLPAVLHVRDAVPEIIEELGKCNFSGELEVHCFMYDETIMNALLQAGVRYFGVGGAVTWQENAALRDAVGKMPLESLLLETDSPFQKPFGYGEKLNTPYSLNQIAYVIANLKGISKEEVLEVTYNNSVRFFGLNNDKRYVSIFEET